MSTRQISCAKVSVREEMQRSKDFEDETDVTTLMERGRTRVREAVVGPAGPRRHVHVHPLVHQRSVHPECEGDPTTIPLETLPAFIAPHIQNLQDRVRLFRAIYPIR